jgi:hypothetical protein
MARKRNTKQRKLEPAVQTLTFALPNGTSTVDLSRCASLVNRRFYRQGINWVVAGFRFFKPGTAPSPGTGVSVARLPNTWVMGNAWEKAFRHWQDLNKRAIEAGESLPGRFTDFKVYMDAIHHGSVPATPNNNLLPIDYDANIAAAGEWEYSKIVYPDTTAPSGARTAEFIGVGMNYPGVSAVSGLDAVSLIEGYANSRALPSITDPNTPADAVDVAGATPENWLGAIDNEGNTQTFAVVSDLTTENNLAPYPFENDGANITTMYPGGADQLPGLQFVDGAYFSTAENANKIYCKGDNFPCGLVRIVQNTEQQLTMAIDLVPGTHRGYLCEPMTEM